MKTKLFRNKLLRKTLASWCAFATLATTTAPVFAATTVMDSELKDWSSNVNTPVVSGSTATFSLDSGSVGVLDWNSYNIYAGQTYKYVGSDAIWWNLVNASAGKSQINGIINGDGSVFVLNPNGIAFGAGSQVNVGGIFAAAAMGMTPADVNAFRTSADPAAFDLTGKIFTGAGDITVNPTAVITADSITLAGNGVTFDGTANGPVTIVSGNKLVVDSIGGGNVSIAFDLGNSDAGNVNLMGTFSDNLAAKAAGDVTVKDNLNVTKAVSLTGVNWFQTAGKKVKADTVKIETTGTGDVALDLVEADTLLKVTTKGDVTQQTGSSITATKVEVTADGDVVLGATANAIKGIEGSAKSVTLTTTEDLAVTGLDTSASDGDIALTLGTDKTATVTGDVTSGGDIAVIGDVVQTDGAIEAADGKTVAITGSFTQTEGDDKTAQLGAVDGEGVALNAVTVTGDFTQTKGTVTVQSITATGDITQNGGTITTPVVTAANITQNGGTITSGGDLTVNGVVTQKAGTIKAAAGKDLTFANDVTQNQAGETKAVIGVETPAEDRGDVVFNGKLTQTKGEIYANALTLNGDSTISNVDAESIGGTGDIGIADGAVMAIATIGDNFDLKSNYTLKTTTVGDGFKQSGGTLEAKDTSKGITFDGAVTQTGGAVVADKVALNDTTKTKAVDLSSTANEIKEISGEAGSLKLVTKKDLTVGKLETGTVGTTPGDADITAKDGTTAKNITFADDVTILTGGKLNLDGAAITQTGGAIKADVVDFPATTVTLTGSGNEISKITGSAENVTVATKVDVTVEDLTVAGAAATDGRLTITAKDVDTDTLKNITFDNTGTKVNTARKIDLTGNTITQNSGTVKTDEISTNSGYNLAATATSLESRTGTGDVKVTGDLVQAGGKVQNIGKLTVTGTLEQNGGTIAVTTIEGDVLQTKGDIQATTIEGDVLQQVTGTDTANIGKAGNAITFKNGNVEQDVSAVTTGKASIKGNVTLTDAGIVDVQSADNAIAQLAGSASNAKVATSGDIAVQGLAVENNLAVSAANDVTLSGNNTFAGTAKLESTSGAVKQTADTTKASVVETANYQLQGGTFESVSGTGDVMVKGDLTQTNGKVQKIGTLSVTDGTLTQKNGDIEVAAISGNVVQDVTGATTDKATITGKGGTGADTITFKNGNVTQDFSGASAGKAKVSGKVVLDNAGTVDLQSAENAVGTLSGTATDVNLKTTSAIALGSLTAGSLELAANDGTAAQNVTQTGALTLGSLKVTDANKVTLDNTNNEIVAADITAASDLKLRQNSDIDLKAKVGGDVDVAVKTPATQDIAIDSTGDLTLASVSAKNVTLTGDSKVTVTTSLTATQDANVTAAGDVSVSGATVTGETKLKSTGGNVAISGANTLSDTATFVAGSGKTVSQTGGTTKAKRIVADEYVLAAGATSLESLDGASDVTVTGSLTQNGGAVQKVKNLTVTDTLTQNNGSVTLASGTGAGTLTATVVQKNGTIKAATIDGNVKQDVTGATTDAATIEGLGTPKAITFKNGDVEQDFSGASAGTAKIDGKVTLDNAGVVNAKSAANAIGELSGTASDVTLTTSDTTLQLGDLTLLSLVLKANDVTQVATKKIDTGALEIEGANVTLDNNNNKVSMAAITTTGNLTLKQKTDVLLSADVGGKATVEVQDNTKQSATITSDKDLTLANVSAKNVSITGDKAVTVEAITAKGDASVTGKDNVTVSAAAIDGAAALQSTAGAVALNKGTLAGSTVGNGLTVDAKTTATVSDTTITKGGADIDSVGNATLTGVTVTKGDLTVDATGTTSDATLTTVTVSDGDVLVAAGDDATLNNASVSGGVDIEAGNDASIVVTAAGKNIGGDVKIDAGNDALIGGIVTTTIGGNVDVDAGKDATVFGPFQIGKGADVDAAGDASVSGVTVTKGDLTVDATGTGSDVTLTTVTVTAGNVAANANDQLTAQNLTVTKGYLEANAGGDIALKDLVKVDDGATTIRTTGGDITQSETSTGSGKLTLSGGDASITADAGKVTIIKADVGTPAVTLPPTPAIENSLKVTGDDKVEISNVTVTKDLTVESVQKDVVLDGTIKVDGNASFYATDTTNGGIEQKATGDLQVGKLATMVSGGDVKVYNGKFDDNLAISGKNVYFGAAGAPTTKVNRDLDINATANATVVDVWVNGGTADIDAGNNATITSLQVTGGDADLDAGTALTLKDIQVDAGGYLDATAGGKVELWDAITVASGDTTIVAGGAIEQKETTAGTSGNLSLGGDASLTAGQTVDIVKADVKEATVINAAGNIDIANTDLGTKTTATDEYNRDVQIVSAGGTVKLKDVKVQNGGDADISADKTIALERVTIAGDGKVTAANSAAATDAITLMGAVAVDGDTAMTAATGNIVQANDTATSPNAGKLTLKGDAAFTAVNGQVLLDHEINVGTALVESDLTVSGKNGVLVQDAQVSGDVTLASSNGAIEFSKNDATGNNQVGGVFTATTADTTGASVTVEDSDIVGNTIIDANTSVTINKVNVGKPAVPPTTPAVVSDLQATGKTTVNVTNVKVTGDTTLTSTTGNVVLSAAAPATPSEIGGSLTVSAPNTTANGQATVSNTKVEQDATITAADTAKLTSVTVTTGDATVTAGTSVDLDTVTVTVGDLAATANDGDLTLKNTVKVGGDAQLTAANPTATTGNINQASGKLEVDGNVSLDAQDNISLGLNNGNYIDGNLTAVAGDNVDLDVIHTLKVDEITSIGGSIDVDVSGAGSQFAMSKATGVVRATAANQTIDISTTGGNITLTKVTADATTGTVNLNAGGDIAMYNDSRSINEITANTLNLTATGKVGDTAGSTVGLRTHVNNESLDVAGNATAENDKSLNFSASPTSTSATGNNVVGGDLTQTVLGGDLTQSVGVAVEVTGVTTLVATDNSATVAKEGNIILEETANDFKNNVNLDTDGYVQIVDANNLKFDQVTVDGFLEAKSVGANIEQVAVTGVTEVQGRTHLEAATGVTLDNAGNDFVGNVSVDNAAGNVSLRDKNDISLGDAFYTGTKEDGVVSGGNVTVATVDGDITLNNLATATTGPGVDYTVEAANVTLSANTTTGTKGNIIQPNQTIGVSVAGYAETPDTAALNTSVKTAGDLVMIADASIGDGEYVTVDAGKISADAGTDASIVGIGGMDVKPVSGTITYADASTETYSTPGIKTGGDADIYTDGTLSTKTSGGLLDVGNNLTVTANAYDRTIDTKLEGSTITVWNIEGHGLDQAAFDLQGGNAHPEVTSTRNNMNVFIDGRYVGGERMNFNQLWNIEAFQMLTPSLDVTYTVDDEGTLTETEEE